MPACCAQSLSRRGGRTAVPAIRTSSDPSGNQEGRVEQIIAQDDKGNELSAQTEQQQEEDPLVFQQCKDRQRDFKRNSKGS